MREPPRPAIEELPARAGRIARTPGTDSNPRQFACFRLLLQPALRAGQRCSRIPREGGRQYRLHMSK